MVTKKFSYIIGSHNSLLEEASTAPGRVRTYLEEDRQTLPHSCSLWVYRNELAELLSVCAQSLKAASGVKVILDEFVAPEPIVNALSQFNFYIPSTYQDYSLLTSVQKQYLAPESILPGYATLVVNDSMMGDGGIIESWGAFVTLISSGVKVIVDLSQLRPYGSVNSNGLIASGAIGQGTKDDESACSFFSIYLFIAKYLESGKIGDLLVLLGALNDTLRRGGYKRGIVCTSMVYTNPSIREYLEFPLTLIPGSQKKAIEVDAGVLADESLCELIVDKCNSESLFLGKIQPNNVHWNVCMGLAVPDKGTCLIWRVNLGQINKLSEIPDAFCKAVESLCKLHITWRLENPEKAAIYSPLAQDRQIGLDVMGLANLLARLNISYATFTENLEYFLNHQKDKATCMQSWRLAEALASGYHRSTRLADLIMSDNSLPLLDRIHTIEPAQSHSFETVDLSGYTTCRGIFPPFAARVRRVSESSKTRVYNHGSVETTSDVPPELHQKICELWQQLMSDYGRPHGISFDTHEEITKDWFEDFILNSPLQTKYYSFYQQASLQQKFLQKSAGVCDITVDKSQCSVCAE